MSTKDYDSLMLKGLGVVRKSLHAEREAIVNLESQYRTDKFSQLNLLKSLDILLSTKIKGGKIVLCGMGKSYKIGTKLSATLNSLSIQSVTLHPAEALHGDLGILHDDDCIIMLSASGGSEELINLIPHIPQMIPIVLLTCTKSSKLADNSRIKALLYTELPAHLKEDNIHGVPAPTVSATLSLILADSVILALSELLEEDVLIRKRLFSSKHPGGSIGAHLHHLTAEDSLSLSLNDGRSLLGSFTSLSSMDHSKSVSSDPSSVGSSSDDESKNTLHDNHKVLLIPFSELDQLTESSFLKNITIYDIITTNEKTLNKGLKSEFLKKLYIEEYVSADITWESFMNSTIINKFKIGYI